MQVKFEFDKDTPGTRRFKEILPEGRTRGVVGSIYLMKQDLVSSFDKLPEKITITVTEG